MRRIRRRESGRWRRGEERELGVECKGTVVVEIGGQGGELPGGSGRNGVFRRHLQWSICTRGKFLYCIYFSRWMR